MERNKRATGTSQNRVYVLFYCSDTLPNFNFPFNGILNVIFIWTFKYSKSGLKLGLLTPGFGIGHPGVILGQIHDGNKPLWTCTLRH